MHIETVLGPIAPEDLGVTLVHEHLEAVAPPGFYSGGESTDIGDLVEAAVRPLEHLGVGALVDLTGRGRIDSGHDFAKLADLASRLPVHVVAGFSFYKDPWLERAGNLDLDDLTSLYVVAAKGEDDGAVKGVFGEVGTSLDVITDREELHLRAVARAHLETGLAISTHCTLGTMGLEQTRILADEGADLSRVVIGHLDLRPDLAYLEQILATGASIGFDTFGKEWFDYQVPGSEGQGGGEYVKWAFHRSDDRRVEALAELCRLGYSGQVVLSTDMSGAESWLNPATHGRFGYAYLPSVILPRLEAAGVTRAMYETMLVEVPRRILVVA